MRPLSLLPLLAFAAANAGETLYNGIALPDAWPPKVELTRAPLAPPPYLAAPPEIIPIDVGRQLFVDDFLIEHTTLRRVHHTATIHPASPVIGPDQPWEGAGGRKRAGVFSDGVWFDPHDQLFKAWYWSGATSEDPLRYSTCLATSRDGLHWEKPRLDVVPGTNIVIPDEGDLRRNSTTIWLDHFETDPARRFKAFRVVSQDYTTEAGKKTHRNFIQLSTSADGIHWRHVEDSVDCGDRSTVFYNAFRRRWVFGLREGHPIVSRARGYYEAPDAISALRFGNPATRNHEIRWWIGADSLDPAREDLPLRRPADRPWDLVPSQLYNLDSIAYESVMLGLFTIWRGHPADEVKRPKINEVCVGFSRDGFHWSRPDRRAFYGVSEDPKTWNYGNVQSAGGCCLIVGDQIWFYFGGTNWANGSRHPDPNNTGLATLRRDGFTSMEGDGTLTTRLVRFSGRHLFLNADADAGEVRAEILDRDGQVLTPFTAENCGPFRADQTRAELKWRTGDLASLAGQPVRVRFHVKNAALYSFWITPDSSGASHGYIAAGGPGFTGPTDTIGAR